MADPLSVAVSCVSLASGITKAAVSITAFVKDVRGARSDLDAVSRELGSLQTLLELLAEDASDVSDTPVPSTLQKQIAGIVTNCTDVVSQIEELVNKYQGNRVARGTMWAMGGQADMLKLKATLEAHKSALELGLEMVALSITREMKNDTQEIRNDTTILKEDTTEILAEIRRLQERLQGAPNQGTSSGFMLNRYLDEISSYAETVCDVEDLDQKIGSDEMHQQPGGMYTSVEPPTKVTPSSSPAKIWDSSPTHVREQKNHEAMVLGHHRRESPPSLPGPMTETMAFNNPFRGGSVSARPGYIGVDDRLGMPEQMKLQADLQSLGLNASDTPIERKTKHTVDSRAQVSKIPSFLGNFVMDCPIPDRILSQVPHAVAPERDEFTHCRFTAVTSKPTSFSEDGFRLRPQLFAKPRQTEIMVIIQQKSPFDPLGQTLGDVISNISHLCSIDNTFWKKAVVCVFRNGVFDEGLKILEEMGVYCNSFDDPSFQFRFNRAYKSIQSVVSGQLVNLRLYEYTSQFTPVVTKKGQNPIVKRGTIPVQMMLCIDPPVFSSIMPFAETFAQVLNPTVCLWVEVGKTLKKDDFLKAWQRASSPSSAKKISHSIGPAPLIQFKSFLGPGYSGDYT